MKGLQYQHFVCAGLALLGLVAAASGSAITEIHDDAFDGVNDATYINHVLTWSSSDFNNQFNIVTVVQDGDPLPGWSSNVVLSLTSNFQNYNQTLQSPARGYFTGGSVSLTFDYTEDFVNWTPCQLSGPVTQGSVEIGNTSPTLSTLTGIFNFDTAQGAVAMPNGSVWPATGLSTAVALTFAIGADLSAYKADPAAWDQNLPGSSSVMFDTQFAMFPEQRPIPEPTLGLLFLAASGLWVVRRHR
jgi:hypothetical protein